MPTPVWPTIVLPITKLRRAVLPSHVRKPPSAASIIYARAYRITIKAFFIALVGQLVPVVQRFSTVACSADVQGSIPAQYLFLIFFPRKLKFFFS